MLKLIVFLTVIGFAFGGVPKQNVSINDPSLKIVGGTVTDISLHPFQVSVQYLNYHFCGGFLISARWVVTAAHCLTQGYNINLNIRAGSSFSTTGGQSVKVSRYIIHPRYSDYTMDNDIALLRLASSITVKSARVAVLPAQNQTIPDGTYLTVTGWGATRENGTGTYALMQVQIPTVNQAVCRSTYSLINTITDNMVCAGFLGIGGRDSCQGDSGGPAAVNGQVVGIVSWGTGCGRPQFPGVYARVASYRDWIARTVNGGNLNSQFNVVLIFLTAFYFFLSSI